MASIVLSKAAAKAGELPPICMRCGAPALGMFPTVLEPWKRGLPLALPFCLRHKEHVKRRFRCAAIALGLAVLFLLLAAWRTGPFFSAVETNPLDPAIDVELICIIAGLIAFFALFIFAALAWRTGIRLEQIDPDSVKIVGVSNSFVLAASLGLGNRVSPSKDNDLATAITASANTSIGDATPESVRELVEWARGKGPLAEDALWVLQEAQLVAISFSHDYVGTEHMLFALRTLVPTTTAYTLKSLAIEPEQIERVIRTADSNRSVGKEFNPPVTPQLRRAILRAFAEAQARGCPVLRASYLLLGLLSETDSTAAQILCQLGHDLENVRQKIIEPEDGIIAHRESIRSIVEHRSP